MNKNLVLFPFLLLCIIFTACIPESAVSAFKFELVNNSQDTIGYSVYTHKKHMNSDEVCYFISYNSIPPMRAYIGGAQHYGYDNSWSSFFKEEQIDTLYIYVAKEVPEAKGQKCKLPNNDNILKVYKYYEENTDLKHMISPIITYP